MMQAITVYTASGDMDQWDEAYDALDDAGALVVLYEIDEDEDKSRMKTLTLRKEVYHGMDLPSTSEPYDVRVAAVYAPGMWIKVEYT